MHIRNAERKFGYRPDKLPDSLDDDLSVVVEDSHTPLPSGFFVRPSVVPAVVLASC